MRLYNGRIFKLHEHLDRLRRSAHALAFEHIPTHEQIIDQIKRTLAANNMVDGVHIRLTLTRGIKITSGMDPRLNQSGPTLIVLAEHKLPVYGSDGISLITGSVRRPSPDCMDPKIHHCNLIQSILAKIEANLAAADDALMLDALMTGLPDYDDALRTALTGVDAITDTEMVGPADSAGRVLLIGFACMAMAKSEPSE